MVWAEKLATGYRGRYRDQNGEKQKIVRPDGTLFPLKKDAIAAAEDARSEARTQAAVATGRKVGGMTWAQLWQLILTERKLDSDTSVTERSIVDNHIMPWWQDVPLNRIVSRERGKDGEKGLQNWIDAPAPGLKVRPGMSAAYVRRVYGVMRLSINIAIEKGILTASPCVKIKLPEPKKKRAKPHLTVKGSNAMALRDDYRDFVDFGLDTGLRPGELCGLHVDQIDWEQEQVWVTNVMLASSIQIRGWPKDGDSRPIPLSVRAIEIARRRTTGRTLNAGCGVPHLKGEPCTSALLFISDLGRPFRPKSAWDYLDKYAQQAGLQRVGVYGIRRGFATRASEKMDPFALARLMGHSSLDETMGYVQGSASERARLMEALDDVERGAVTGAESDQEAPEGAEVGGSSDAR